MGMTMKGGIEMGEGWQSKGWENLRIHFYRAGIPISLARMIDI